MYLQAAMRTRWQGNVWLVIINDSRYKQPNLNRKKVKISIVNAVLTEAEDEKEKSSDKLYP